MNIQYIKSKMVLVFAVMLFVSCGSNADNNFKEEKINMQPANGEKKIDNSKYQVATFGEGCFWCSEAVFQRLKGVVKVESGYSGGYVPNPTYEAVCTGKTGHAEVIQVTYDPSIISYTQLLRVFWNTHDPTTLNRQGNDLGTQYRSIILYHDEEQKELAERYKHELDSAKVWNEPVVTEIVPFKKFYKAEDYHQNYYNQHGNQPYCSFVITPKVEKFEKVFADMLKKE